MTADDTEEPNDDADVFYCQLNAVFALGAQFDSTHDAEWKAFMGNMFYNRVLGSLKFHFMEHGTIELPSRAFWSTR